MEDILTDHEEFQDSHNESSCMDLSLIGKGKEFRKLNSYIASLVVLLIMVNIKLNRLSEFIQSSYYIES